MELLGNYVKKIRSKNAGPFWITVDIFCGTDEIYQHVSNSLSRQSVSHLLEIDVLSLKRFDIESLNVIKFSFIRKNPQGCLKDRDMHGAQIANLFYEIEI